MSVSDVRHAYVTAAEVAAALLRDPAVEAGWVRPSALREFSVGGLAGHLAAQIFNVRLALEAEVPEGCTPLSVREHYAQARWLAASLDEETNVLIRRGGEKAAANGPVELNTRAGVELRRLRDVLAAEPADRAVFLPWTGWVLSLDDLLLTRLMEIAVHCDDLAASIGEPTPQLPDVVLDPVLTLLTDLAVRRHGQVAVLRALSRSERAPATISAL
jgi:hypothetical protein